MEKFFKNYTINNIQNVTERIKEKKHGIKSLKNLKKNWSILF